MLAVLSCCLLILCQWSVGVTGMTSIPYFGVLNMSLPLPTHENIFDLSNSVSLCSQTVTGQ